MNHFLDINRVEFLMTGNCSSKCKHCSNSQHKKGEKPLSLEKGIEILDIITKEYKVDSVLIFGGEPLLYPETTAALFQYAKKLNIPTRQLITNGFWSTDRSRIDEICNKLYEAGINDILISVDSFHQEYLDFETVEYTILKLREYEFPNLQLHPCWYISKDGKNEYDEETNRLLNKLSKYNIPISDGNTLFPAGNAVKNFPSRFKPLTNIKDIGCGILPYSESPNLIKSVCINPQGMVNSLCFGPDLKVEDFLKKYNPYSDKSMKVFMEDGIEGLMEIITTNNLKFDITNYYSICDACSSLRRITNEVL